MSKRAEKAKAAIAKAKAQTRPAPTARQVKADAKYAERKAKSQEEIAEATKKQGGGR